MSGMSFLIKTNMKKLHNVSEIRFDKEFLYIKVDNRILKIKLSEISDRLVKANDNEKNDYQISPSGYGIHWRLIDEDLSINGLLNQNKLNRFE